MPKENYGSIYGEYCEYGYRICRTNPDRNNGHDIDKFGNNPLISDFSAMLDPDKHKVTKLETLAEWCEGSCRSFAKQNNVPFVGVMYSDDMREECAEYFTEGVL